MRIMAGDARQRVALLKAATGLHAAILIRDVIVLDEFILRDSKVFAENFARLVGKWRASKLNGIVVTLRTQIEESLA